MAAQVPLVTPPMEGPLEPRFANYLEVGFNDAEFQLVFGQFYDQAGEPMRHTRLVTTALYAREFGKLLVKTVEEFEREHGRLDKG
jgi:hypothetical protein